jgi:hypothetical protein
LGPIVLQAGSGRTSVQLEAQPIGEEWLVVITNTGGHLGAIAVGEYDPLSGRASASVLTMAGHRDDRIAWPQAQTLAKALRRRVAVIAGVHIEHATVEDIQCLVANAEALVSELLAHLADKLASHE